MKLKGIDISHFQGTPDFSKLRGQVDFIILQIGYGRYASQVDKQFERNYAQCKKYGIPVGGYWFSYAATAAEAKQEAEVCLSVIKGKQFEHPIWFDVEGKSLTNRTAVSAMCQAFCGALEQAGYFTGIYMSRSPAQTHLTQEVARRYALWLAEYGSRLNWSGSAGMWQYSSTGTVPGISGNVDLDECYVDYPSIIKAKGLGGFKAQPVQQTKTLDKDGFRQGQQSDGILALKGLLAVARNQGLITQTVDPNGIFGKGTAAAVNALLTAWGHTPNGIAGPNFISRLTKELTK